MGSQDLVVGVSPIKRDGPTTEAGTLFRGQMNRECCNFIHSDRPLKSGMRRVEGYLFVDAS